MRKELWMLLCAFMLSISSFAQSTLLDENEDSTINCIAFFDKGDTVEYRVTDRSYKLKDNLKDTVFTTDVAETIRFAVLDSTSKGYRIEMAYTSFENKLKEDTATIEDMIANAMAPVLLKNKVIFTTDEYGKVKHIENWKELREKLKTFFDQFLDTLYTKHKKLTEIPKSLFSSAFYMQIATEPNMQKVFDEIDQLFGNFGLQFNIGHSSNDESASGYKQRNSSICGYISENDSDFYEYNDDYFLSFINKVNVPAKDIKSLGLAGLGALAGIDEEANDSISKAFDDFTKGRDLNIYQTEDAYYFFNGWPKYSVKSKYVTLGDDQIIRCQQQTIEWDTRNWSYSKREEDTSKSL